MSDVRVPYLRDALKAMGLTPIGEEKVPSYRIGRAPVGKNLEAMIAVTDRWLEEYRQSDEHRKIMREVRRYDEEVRNGPRDYAKSETTLSLTDYVDLRIGVVENEEDEDCREGNFLKFSEYMSGGGDRCPRNNLKRNPDDKFTPDRFGWFAYLDREMPAQVRELAGLRVKAQIADQDVTNNIYILGAPQKGKTELAKVLAWELAQKDNQAVVILDPSGLLVEECKFKQFVGSDRLVVIDPVDPLLADGRLPTINIFHYPGPVRGDQEERLIKDNIADQIKNVLLQMLAGGSTLSTRMENVLLHCSRALLDVPDANMYTLYRLVMLDRRVLEDCRNTKSSAAYEFLFGGEGETKGPFQDESYKVTRDAVADRLNGTFLKSDLFKNLTCGPSTINLDELLSEKKILLFNLAEGDLQTIGLGFGQLVLALLFSVATRRIALLRKNMQPVPCTVIIDEFQSLVQGSVFDGLQKLRKYNFRWVFIQPAPFSGLNRDQINTFLSTVRTRFVGKCDATSDGAKICGVADAREIDRLDRGQFYLKREGSPKPCLIETRTDLLGKAASMSDDDWRQYAQTLGRYYRRVTLFVPPEPSAPPPPRERPAASGPRIRSKRLDPN